MSHTSTHIGALLTMHRLEGKLALSTGGASVTLGSQSLVLDPKVVSQRPRLREYNGQSVAVSVEKSDDAAPQHDAPGEQRLTAKVDRVERIGSDLIVHGIIDAKPVSTKPIAEAGERDVRQLNHPSGAAVIARFNPLSNVRVGDRVDVAVDTSRMSFFDLDTGLAIWD
jgi:multiple sugar transport system ATP-binding protein